MQQVNSNILKLLDDGGTDVSLLTKILAALTSVVPPAANREDATVTTGDAMWTDVSVSSPVQSLSYESLASLVARGLYFTGNPELTGEVSDYTQPLLLQVSQTLLGVNNTLNLIKDSINQQTSYLQQAFAPVRFPKTMDNYGVPTSWTDSIPFSEFLSRALVQSVPTHTNGHIIDLVSVTSLSASMAIPDVQFMPLTEDTYPAPCVQLPAAAICGTTQPLSKSDSQKFMEVSTYFPYNPNGTGNYPNFYSPTINGRDSADPPTQGGAYQHMDLNRYARVYQSGLLPKTQYFLTQDNKPAARVYVTSIGSAEQTAEPSSTIPTLNTTTYKPDFEDYGE